MELKQSLNNISQNQSFQKNEFLCPECGQLPPEILNINVDNKIIEFLCKICGKKEYNAKFFCLREDLDNIIYYFKQEDRNEYYHYWFKEFRRNNESLTDKKDQLKKLISNNEFKKSKKIIKQKNEQLKKIIKFNEIIIETCEKYLNNYFHVKSLKNISISLGRENLRDSNDLKYLFTVFNNEIEFSEKAIAVFEKAIKVDIKREEENLFLSKKKINDENIKCLSLIKFNQLKEIDLSENEITSIELLCNMNLPFLKFLNLSYNKIKNIEPLSEINSRKLKFLFIQNNQIEDIHVFLNNDFPKLEILRLENNKIKENSNSFQNLINLYTRSNMILITREKEINEIKRRYNIEYNENMTNVEVEDIDEGDLMLRYLFIIFSHKNKNKIQKLKLSRNKIEEPSILNRIQFDFLEEFDLSSNNIKNLKFLKGMKAKNLKRLYLNNNYIKDLSPLYNIREYFPLLECINLGNNNFNPQEWNYEYFTSYINTSDEGNYVENDFNYNYNYFSVRCFYCNKICKENRNIYLYCYDCIKEFCRKCEEKHRQTNNMHTKIIKVNEKNYRCYRHYDEEDI